MKRLLVFLVGALSGLGIALLLKRWLGSAQPVSIPANTPSNPAEKLPDPTTNSTPASSNSEGRIRYTVRTFGPRPQVVVPTDALEAEVQPTPSLPDTSDTTPPAEEREGLEPATQALPEEVNLPTDAAEGAVSAETESAASPEGTRDDFQIIPDIGPKFSAKLYQAGITTFERLAALTPDEIEQLTGIPTGRIVRNQWNEQAAKLARPE